MILPRRWLRPSSSLVLSAGLLCITGCGPGGSSPSNTTKFENQAPGTSSAPAAPPSAEANSFDEVAARLDRGGSLYFYLSTAEWLDGLSGQIAKLRESLPVKDMSPRDRRQLDQITNVATSLIKSSGIEQISGVGASSLAVEPGLYRNSAFIHHYKGKETGLLNTMFGASPHALATLNLLPANVALASSGDYDIPGLVHLLVQTIAGSGIPELQKESNESLQKFQMVTGMSLDEFLSSLGMEMDVVLTLDPDKKIEVPSGDGKTMKIPAPRLAIMIEVKDDKLFNKLDEQLGAIPQIIKTEEPGLKMRTFAFPLQPDFEVRATVARWDKFLVIASNDSLIRDMIAAQKGGPGYKASPGFAKLSEGLPKEGNGFNLTTRLFQDTVRDAQRQVMENQGESARAQMEWLSKYMFSTASADSLTISAHVENGWLAVNKGSAGATKLLAPALMIPIGIGVGAALPVFNTVSTRGKATKGLAQAKQIGLACKLYAGDNDGKFPPTLNALVPTYLQNSQLFISPFAPNDPMGYHYYGANLTESSPPETVLLEDKYTSENGRRATVHVDDSAELR